MYFVTYFVLGCGGRLNTASGSLTYPPEQGQGYEHDTDCGWVISTAQNKVHIPALALGNFLSFTFINLSTSDIFVDTRAVIIFGKRLPKVKVAELKHVHSVPHNSKF